MDYRVEKSATALEFFLSGRMTFADHDKFRDIIATFEGPNDYRVVFDLLDLSFVDSSGLGMFIIARDMAQKRNLRFVLRSPRDDVKRLILVAKFHKMFAIENLIAEAPPPS
ncbi:HptB-dependent secretion and biofilm anti anti-sigma factor [uncultured Gammaproteobacteria bacterium]